MANLPRLTGTLPNGTKTTIEFGDPDGGLKALVWLQEKCGGPPEVDEGWERLQALRKAELDRSDPTAAENAKEESFVKTTWTKAAIKKGMKAPKKAEQGLI